MGCKIHTVNPPWYPHTPIASTRFGVRRKGTRSGTASDSPCPKTPTNNMIHLITYEEANYKNTLTSYKYGKLALDCLATNKSTKTKLGRCNFIYLSYFESKAPLNITLQYTPNHYLR
jgi:hypothetical protein